MTKSNSKGEFEPSILETIHSEGNTPQSSASHEELLASLQVASDLGPPSPNPGRVIHSVRSSKVDDDIIDTRPSADKTKRPYPAGMQSRKSMSLPHFAQKNHAHLQRPASGDYDGQEALFEDLMGSASDLVGAPGLSQVLPENNSAPSPSFSRAIKAALFGKVDFGHAFSQSHSDSQASEQESSRQAVTSSSLYGEMHRLSINEDESQTPKASPTTQRKSSYPDISTAGTCSTQETVTPQGSPHDTRKLIEESNSENFLPPPPTTPSSVDTSSINSSSISDTTIILPCPPEFASDSPQLSRSRTASNSPRISERKYSIPEESSGSLSPAIIRKDKSKTPEASSSKFKPFSVVRRAHSFSQTRRIQRPISVIGLVHTTRDNSDLLDLDDAIRLKRMTGEGSPMLKTKGSPDLFRRESDSAVLVSSLTENRSPVIRSNTSSPMDQNGTDSPLDGSSSPDSISAPATSSNRSPRTVRWSLLRPKGHKQKPQKAEDQVGEVSPNGSLLGVVEEGLHCESPKAAFEPDQPGNTTVQQHKTTAGDSLFAASQENGVVSRRKSKLRKRRDKRSLTIAGTELELSAMKQQQQQKTSHQASRVFKLAREYSQKIKERRFQRTSSTINVSLEEEDEKRHQVSGQGVSLSQTHQNPDGSQNDPFVQEWLLNYKEPSTNHYPTASKALSTNNLVDLSTNLHVDIGSQTLSDGQKTPRDSTTFDLPGHVQKDDLLASSSPELPNNFQGQKSISMSRFTSVADEMMMQGVNKEERRKGKFGGWVKSLVNKFGK